jgi:hypothetical protein
MHLPIIKLELDRVRESVSFMLSDHNKELNGYVKQSIDKCLNEEWVMHEIDMAVTASIRKAITSLSEDYTLQRVICNAVSDVIAKKFEGGE